jgi:hypothetical protein
MEVYMKKACSLLAAALIGTGLSAKYEREVVRDSEQPGFTYISSNGKYKVTLSPDNLRKIEAILKPFVMWDYQYTQRITPGWIQRVVGTCQCGEDAAMLEEVLNDFRGDIVRTLFNRLGLRNEL